MLLFVLLLFAVIVVILLSLFFFFFVFDYLDMNVRNTIFRHAKFEFLNQSRNKLTKKYFCSYIFYIRIKVVK